MGLKDLNISDLSVPFDMITLPSRGMFYSGNSPHVLVRYLTGSEENLLSSPSLIDDGLALSIVFKNVILSKSIDYESLLIGDRNAILLFLRSTAYGDKFSVEFPCPKCSKKSEASFLLSDFEMKEIIDIPDNDGSYMFQLPKSGSFVKFKPLTVKDEVILNKISKIEESRGGVKSSVTSKYNMQIVSIDDNSDENYINKFVKMMTLQDSAAFRKYTKKVEPGINSMVSLKCSNCGKTTREEFEITPKILGLTPDYRKDLLEELFLVSYYSKGGISRKEAWDMSVYERRWSIRRINEEIEKKNKAEQDAIKSSKGNSRTK